MKKFTIETLDKTRISIDLSPINSLQHKEFTIVKCSDKNKIGDSVSMPQVEKNQYVLPILKNGKVYDSYELSSEVGMNLLSALLFTSLVQRPMLGTVKR